VGASSSVGSHPHLAAWQFFVMGDAGISSCIKAGARSQLGLLTACMHVSACAWPGIGTGGDCSCAWQQQVCLKTVGYYNYGL
jgi:hypothetical protein